MAIAPSHTRVGGLPRYFFVGRKNEISIFTKTLESDCAPDEYAILTISALGGQGKSSLLARMREALKDEKYAEFPSATIDFDLAAQRDPINALIALRNQFAAAGVQTNAFDIAFARHFLLTRPGRDIRADHPELFKFSNDLLDDVVDTLGSVITELPGAKLVYSILKRLSQKGVDWYRKRGEPLLAQLDEIPAHHLRAELPMFLGADLSAYCADNPGKRPVIFYDTHEALWRGTQRIDFAAETAPDSWLRRFVQESPRVLHVIAGRRPLDWAQIDDEWSKYITSIDLRELDTESADEIFDRAALKSEPIRERILSASQGHALTLRVNVRIYEALIGEGKTPVPEDFPLVAREAFDRFFDHLDPNTRAAVRALAIPQYIDDAIWEHLSKIGIAAFDLVSQKDVLDEVYFRKDAQGRHFMHELVRDGIRENLAASDPVLLKRLHATMFEYHNERSKYDGPANAKMTSEEHVESLLEASGHLLASAPERFSSWCFERFSTDLADISIPEHRERLLEEARKRMGELGATNWQDAVKLARIEVRMRPYASVPLDLTLATKQFWSSGKIDETALVDLRSILWIYKITGQSKRYEEIAQPILKLGAPKRASEVSFLLELLLAIEANDRDTIGHELKRTIDAMKQSDKLGIGWCVLAGILMSPLPDAVDYLREQYDKSGGIARLVLLHHMLATASEIGDASAGIDLVLRLAHCEAVELPEFLLQLDAPPSFRCLALLELINATRAAKRDDTKALTHWSELDDRFAQWKDWTDQHFVEMKLIPDAEHWWLVEKGRIEWVQKHAMLPWQGIDDLTIDLFVSEQGEVCLISADFRLCWREIDYVAYYNFGIYFFDRKFGLFTFGVEVNEDLRRHFNRGVSINLITFSGALAEAVLGVTQPLLSFESDDQVRGATNFSSANLSVH